MDEYTTALNKLRDELGFTPTIKELDEVFFITDYLQREGYVSNQLSRAVCGRIVDTFNSWIGAFHDWVTPNPGSMISMEQSNAFNDAEKQEIITLIKAYMQFITRNIIIGITKDTAAETAFINDAMTLWNDSLPQMVQYTKKVNAHWG